MPAHLYKSLSLYCFVIAAQWGWEDNEGRLADPETLCCGENSCWEMRERSSGTTLHHARQPRLRFNMKSCTLFFKMQISDTIPREPNSVDWMESRGSVFLMSTSGSLTLADEAGLSWGPLHTSENHQLWVQAPQLHSPILTPRLLL